MVQQRPARVFISYSHKDQRYLEELVAQLRILQRTGVIEPWHDRSILPSSDWSGVIDEQLRNADIILLLVSANFLNSDYCYDIEMDLAMERHEKGEALVIPIFVGPCLFEKTRFAHLQGLPRDGRAVAERRNRGRVWSEIAEEIARLVPD